MTNAEIAQAKVDCALLMMKHGPRVLQHILAIIDTEIVQAGGDAVMRSWDVPDWDVRSAPEARRN